LADTIWSGPSALDNIRAFSQGVAPGWYQAAPLALIFSHVISGRTGFLKFPEK